VRQKVAWAAKTRFNQAQRPVLLPPIKPDDRRITHLNLTSFAHLFQSALNLFHYAEQIARPNSMPIIIS
jgi:hypothetical protein